MFVGDSVFRVFAGALFEEDHQYSVEVEDIQQHRSDHYADRYGMRGIGDEDLDQEVASGEEDHADVEVLHHLRGELRRAEVRNSADAQQVVLVDPVVEKTDDARYQSGRRVDARDGHSQEHHLEVLAGLLRHRIRNAFEGQVRFLLRQVRLASGDLLSLVPLQKKPWIHEREQRVEETEYYIRPEVADQAAWNPHLLFELAAIGHVVHEDQLHSGVQEAELRYSKLPSSFEMRSCTPARSSSLAFRTK